MLAYVFWHWRRHSVPAADYEDRLGRFHQVLGRDPPRGFLNSLAVSLSGVPWANAGSDAYEDWYVIDGSSALDVLNDAAISAARQAPHDRAAAAAAGGTAGLYRLRLGEGPIAPAVAYWFHKPAAMSYQQLFDDLGPLVNQNRATLWGRQMTLGPSPEFCFHAGAPVVFPASLSPLMIRLRPVCDSRSR